MSQNPKQNDLPQEEKVINAEKSKSIEQTNLGIATVKSKIREKDASVVSDNDDATNQKHAKLSASKIAKLIKPMRSKSRTVNLSENEDSGMESPPKSDYPVEVKLESDTEHMEDAVNPVKSKKSISAQNKSVSKIKRLLSVTEDENFEAMAKANKKSQENAQTAYMVSHDQLETTKSALNRTVNEQSDAESLPPRSTESTNIHERGNYLSNIIPQPLDEWANDHEDDSSKKENQTN